MKPGPVSTFLLIAGIALFPPHGWAASQIFFTSERDGNEEIYAVGTDGVDLINITGTPNNEGVVAVAPDGLTMAFRSLNGQASELFILDINSGARTRLTENAVFDSEPTWSPDGTSLAFTSARTGNFDIFLLDIGTLATTQVTTNSFFDGCPAWSPDGGQLAFESDRDGNSEIYLMNADGSAPVNLTQSPAADTGPAWSACPLGETAVSYQSWGRLKLKSSRQYFSPDQNPPPLQYSE
ncbi:MAG: hypothetical protein GKR89_13795 [Candidatus Latescibacteria bacterium]|nr:hypothetical protein [Candidatus Latescibacterota bacterium]